MSTFPQLADKPDSQYYRVEKEDPGMKNEMEGGYVVSRPRFTRKPRRTFYFGYTDLAESEHQKLVNFWDEVRGSSQIFEWTNQFTGEVIYVRFKNYWTEKYTGAGAYRRFTITGLAVEEV